MNDLINVDSRDFLRKLDRMASAGKNMRKPLIEIGKILERSIETNFQVGGRYSEVGSVHGGSKKWDNLSTSALENYASRRNKGRVFNKRTGNYLKKSESLIANKKILIDTAILKNSFSSSVTSNTLSTGTNVEYAAIRNFGFNDTVNVKSHTRKGKNVKAHTRKVKIKANPFLVIQKNDWNDFSKVLLKHI